MTRLSKTSTLAAVLLAAMAATNLWRPESENREPGPDRRGPETVAQRLPIPTEALSPTQYGGSERQVAQNPASPVAEFDEWLAIYLETPSGDRLPLVPLGIEKAVARREQMHRLIRNDPREALARAVSRDLRKELPPEIVAELEVPFDALADLEVVTVCDDDKPGHEASVTRHLSFGGEQAEAHLYGRREGLTTKRNLPVHGILLDGDAAVHERPVRPLTSEEAAEAGAGGDEPALQAGEQVFVFPDSGAAREFEQALIAAESTAGPEALYSTDGETSPASTADRSWTTGEKKVLYLRLDFDDRTGAPLSSEKAEEVLAGVDHFFRDNSGGRTSLAAAVLPEVLRLPQSAEAYRGSGYLQLRDDALAAAREFDRSQGGGGLYDPDEYDLYVLAFNQIFPGWGGRAAVGGRGVWLNGFFDAGITAHEIGHNYGVFHANTWEPSGSAPAGDGQHVEYGDRFDAMGISSNVFSGRFQDGHFNSWFKSYLGWMDQADSVEITSDGVYRLYRHDHPEAAGARALQVPAGSGRAYWLGVRRLFTGNDRLTDGVDVRLGRTNSGLMSSMGSELLDMKPHSAGGWEDHPLALGERFSDLNHQIHITPVAAGGEGAASWVDVEISLGTTDVPVIETHPEAKAAAEGTNVTFSVRASGPEPLRFQWLKNGIALPEATESTLRLDAISGGDEADYSVVVSNDHGSTTSNRARLDVLTEGSGQPGSVDTSFDPSAGPNGPVFAIAIQEDGHILIGGSFTSVDGEPRNRIARLLPDGRLDPSFDPGNGFDQNVWKIALQADGRILAGGLFTSFNGVVRNRVARLHPDGNLDFSFDPGEGANQAVRDIHVQPDGRIIIGGAFTAFDGAARSRIARLTGTGAVDPTFDPGADGTVWSVLVHEGEIYLGGAFSSIDGAVRNGVARLLDDGRLDPAFDPGEGANGAVYAMEVQPAGKLVVAGSFTRFGPSAGRIARLHSDGSRDTAFAPGEGADDFIWSIHSQADGKLIVSGWFSHFDGASRSGIARLHRDGSSDTGFSPGSGANDLVWPSAIDADGGVLLAGRFTSVDGATRPRVARLHGDATAATPSSEAPTYEDWRAHSGLPQEETEPTADPGNHGIPNLLRYAFGLDPHLPNRLDLPSVTTVQAGDGSSYLTLTYYRRQDHGDLSYTVEVSEDLSNWQALADPVAVTVADGDGRERVTVRDAVPLETVPGDRFLRVRIDLAAE